MGHWLVFLTDDIMRMMKRGFYMNHEKNMLNGLLYHASDETLTLKRKQARNQVYKYNKTKPTASNKRQKMLKEMLGGLGSHVKIHPPVYLDYGKHLFVGDYFYANYGCVFLDVNHIKIGDHVMFGPYVSIYTAGHPVDKEIRNEGLEYGYAVDIKDNVWIGGGTIINPGVTIGENTIIGSGSVVTKDIPANVIAFGNPCKVHRKITKEDQRYWENEKLKAQKNGD